MQENNISNRENKVNPFPGLRPFGIEESYLYFGREGQSDEVLSILEKNRFVNILGSSGTGKSSLMFSGVIPTLHGGFISKAGSEWEIITAKPGLNPIKNLALGFKKHIESKSQDDPTDFSHQLINEYLFEAVLNKSTKGLSDLFKLNKYLKGKNLLLYLDQFEEIFRFRKLGETKHINESLAYVNLILEAIRQSEVPIYIALSMRSDFLGDCEQFPELTNKINDSHYLIPQMTREQKKLVITGPVAVGNAKISNRLVQRLLNDMGDRFDQLPVLQHALMRTWDYWIDSKKDDDQIDFIHYEAIGGVNEALSRHADEAFYELNEEEKEICEKLFKTITEKRSDNDGIRRPTPLKEISKIVDEEEHILIKIIDKFRIEGRALLTPREEYELHSDSVIDISHEALMRVWYRLKNWVQEESQSAQIYLRLSEAANKFQQGSGGLWRPPDLQLAIEWRNSTKPTLKWALQYENNFEAVILFLEKSEESYKKELETKELLQKRRLRRSKVIATILGTAAVLSIIFLVYAFNQSRIAERQREIAESKSQEAQRESDRAKESELIAQRQKIEANKSSIRANAEREKAEYSFLLVQEARDVEKKAREELAIKATEEEKARKDAQEKSKQLELTNLQLEDEKNNSRQYSMRAIASSLSVKSLQQEDDELKGLLALLGFRFNINNEGYENNNDIYNGLFYAVKNYDPEYYNAFKSKSTDVRSLQFVKNKYLYTTSASGRINAWEVENKTANRSIVIFDEEGVFVKKIYVDEENQILVALTDSHDFYVIDVADRIREIQKYSLPNSYAYDVSFIEGTTDFYLSASDNFIYKFTNNSLEPYLNTKSRIYDIELISENILATGNTDGKIELWDMNSKKSRAIIREANDKYIHSLSFSNNILATGDNSGQVNLFYLDDKYNVQNSITLRGSDGEIMTDIQFNMKENQIIAASTKGTIRIWNLIDPDEFPMIINEPGSWVNAIALMDQAHIFAGCKDQVFRLYPIKSEILAETLKNKINRDITPEEWDRYIGDDLDYSPIFEQSKFIDQSR
ncbi:nSTAND1 domain-containing NTPase [Marivirga harenae]|uniref:nSTAND1 domain-containing NTPase n=1 Tax=Marivirga harenae TaxID=2010992 RepID=UPI0026E109F1|nr:High-affnity carbon uptake protein Hat/HatR [Marivirga harenae]WKV11763.1 High-affnity carbon uptake protein Hat/HatR [Marivirga harenae]